MHEDANSCDGIKRAPGKPEAGAMRHEELA